MRINLTAPENRLVQAVSGTVTTNLTYDPLGRLNQSDKGSNATTTRFHYDGDALVAEYNSSNGLVARYVHGSNAAADDPLMWYKGTRSSDVQYLHADYLGSIVAVAKDNGRSEAKNAYDEYGIPGANNIGRFQYTGQTWIPETGMYYYKARMYSPSLGRFMQTDPIGYKDQVNLYAYVGNDPVNSTDPNGLQSCPQTPCPDIRPPPVAKSLELRREVIRTPGSGGVERGGQLLKDDRSGALTIRTGDKAGVGTEGQFAHNPNPEGKTSVQRSHTHLSSANEEKGFNSQSARVGQNAPGRDDQVAMQKGNASIQTIGPDVTTSLYRIDNQDYLRVDTGDSTKIPDLSSQKIIVCTGSTLCPQ